MKHEDDTSSQALIGEAHLALLRHHTDEAEVLLKLALASDHDNTEARRMLEELGPPANLAELEPDLEPEAKKKPRLDLTTDEPAANVLAAAVSTLPDAVAIARERIRKAEEEHPRFFSPWRGWSAPWPGWAIALKLALFIGIGLGISYLPGWVRMPPPVYGPVAPIVRPTVGGELHMGVLGNLILGVALGVSAFFATRPSR